MWKVTKSFLIVSRERVTGLGKFSKKKCRSFLITVKPRRQSMTHDQSWDKNSWRDWRAVKNVFGKLGIKRTKWKSAATLGESFYGGGPDNKGPCFMKTDFCCSSCVNHLLAMFNILLDYQIVLRNYLFARNVQYYVAWQGEWSRGVDGEGGGPLRPIRQSRRRCRDVR